nr:MAG TPA: hypothetical protein [Caudoviricetes sp.]
MNPLILFLSLLRRIKILESKTATQQSKIPYVRQLTDGTITSSVTFVQLSDMWSKSVNNNAQVLDIDFASDSYAGVNMLFQFSQSDGNTAYFTHTHVMSNALVFMVLSVTSENVWSLKSYQYTPVS